MIISKLYIDLKRAPITPKSSTTYIYEEALKLNATKSSLCK